MWEIFEKLCQERGVTPYRVSEATGIKTSALSGWKHGRFKFKQDKLKKIADYFGVSVEYLMTGEEPEEGYYVNPETAEMAQKIFENRDLRLLFDAAEDASPEDLQLVHQMLLALKSKERG
ncbi:MAG: helix-turn-helix transcriptional regulator [Firmicutes bacterium]|nr:helix-turn-helix transcriptional regulator [Bacillota bacterium]